MFPDIEKIVAVSPVFRETPEMIEVFSQAIAEVASRLSAANISFEHFYLDDGAVHLPDSAPCLVSHAENQGLATTLIEGYEAALELEPDLIVKLDTREHDPLLIPFVAERIRNERVDAAIVPVSYSAEAGPRPSMPEVMREILDFSQMVKDEPDIARVLDFSFRFPDGYHAYRPSLLRKILPLMRSVYRAYAERFGHPPCWGFDVLNVVLAARLAQDKLDFFFDSWSTEWQKEERMEDALKRRRRKEEVLLVARDLGYV